MRIKGEKPINNKLNEKIRIFEIRKQIEAIVI